jgi:hypothetical protein
MKFFIRVFTAVCLTATCLFVVPSASADDWNRKTVITFTEPVEVPGVGAQVLPPGTYVFKIMDSLSDRHIVQIFNQDQTHVFTTILAVPNFRLQPTDKTVMTFKERAEGQPEAIRAWFYPGSQWGEEFVYSKSKALNLAKVVNQPVLATSDQIATVDELKTAPIEAVSPAGEPVPVAEVVQPPPVETASLQTPKLPATASYLPLIACFGLLSLGAAGAIGKFSA